MSHHMTHGYIALSVLLHKHHRTARRVQTNPAISASDIFDTESNSLIASRKLSHQSAHVCVAHPARGIPYVVSYVRSQVTRILRWRVEELAAIPPVPPSTPRQKIPSCCVVSSLCCCCCFLSAFFLSLSSLSLSRVVCTRKWSEKLAPMTPLKHLKSLAPQRVLLRTNTLNFVAPFGYSHE